jgi:hypothetical protein
MLERERLLAVLRYDAATGLFFNLVHRSSRAPIGANAGSKGRNGYRYISIDGRSYLAHRLAWLYVNGEWPSEQVDHVNGDRGDNRIANLRLATPSENGQNRKRPLSSNRVGLLGVFVDKGRFVARICANGRTKHLGTFDSAEAAHEAYLLAKQEMHPFSVIA